MFLIIVDVANILGRSSISFGQFVSDHIHHFTRDPVTILVTGATGNVGRSVVEQLVVKPGVIVRATSRFAYLSCSLFLEKQMEIYSITSIFLVLKL